MKKYLAITAAFIIFILAWQLLAMLVQKPFLPEPGLVAAVLLKLAAQGELWPHLAASLSRILWALLVSTIPAAAMGLASGRSPRFNNIISPVIYLLHPLPKAAFLPVIMLFFGYGEVSKIFLVAFIIFSQILVNLRDAAKQVPSELIDSVRSLGADKAGVLRHVVIPSVLPAFFTGLRISLGTAVAVLFLAETFAAQSGLGYLIMDAWTRIAYPQMYAAILSLSILGLFLFILTDFIETLLCPWLGRQSND